MAAETRLCKKCSGEYESQYWTIGGMINTRLLKGDGYCPACARNVYGEEVAREETKRLAEIARIRRQHRETSGIPPKFMNQDFSTFEKGWQDKALKKCQEYAEKFPVDRYPRGYRSLYLWSTESWGTGKTHLSAAVCHRILDRWTGMENKGCPRIIFLSEPELFRRIQATYSFTREESQVRESEDDIIRGIIGADFVVLDDIGKEKRKDMDFVQRTLFAIINGRYKEKLPLIITANLDPTGLKEHLESASFDRLWEMVKGKSVRMDGKSYRRKSDDK
jgi:DNA replication protein DnaC